MTHVCYSAVLCLLLIGQLNSTQLHTKNRAPNEFNPKNPRNCRELPPLGCMVARSKSGCSGGSGKYFYEPRVNQCLEYKDGRCTSKRLFRNGSDCWDSCHVMPDGCRDETPEKCLVPASKGTCSANILKYYYDAATNKCNKFLYSGCGGNTNNFWSEPDCYFECAVP